ncbi:MAG TPA: Ppx/GppA phosphatase family protein [Polyangia bacterium]|jgi:exopolyphosphatase/guanosine-5'-triphosphate,3'-diphosphate pyrophosphatase
MKPKTTETLIAAIDVGANAVRLEIARGFSDGSIESVHQERDPVRPGEGLFQTGFIPADVADRLIGVLRRYAIICKRHQARVRAVGTSALREAKNRDDIIRRAKREAGLVLEAISGKEEARLMCMGILSGQPTKARSLCIDIGGGSTEVAGAVGDRPTKLWSVAIGSVRLTEIFKSNGEVSPKQLRLLREFAREAVEDSLPAGIRGFPRVALGSSGSIRAIIASAAAEGTAHATAEQISHVVEKLARMEPEERHKRFDAKRGDVILAGAVILEALAHHLSLRAVTAVDRGLRHGVLVDLVRRRFRDADDSSLIDAARTMGRRFFFDEAHAMQVEKLALAMFDQLAALHRLPMAVRPYLEVAAVLHDIGHSVSYQKHHRHTEYLVRNGDIPGLADRERDIVARIARFHRRSPPDLHHPGMEGLSPGEARYVRKLAMLLRVADALDRSHAQPISGLRAQVAAGKVVLHLLTNGTADLELWDVGHEAVLFRKVFGASLTVTTASSRHGRGAGRKNRRTNVT